MEKDEDMLSEDRHRMERIRAAEMESEVLLFFDKDKNAKKKQPADRRKSQGLLTYVLNENYIGDQLQMPKDCQMTGSRKIHFTRGLGQD